MDLAKLVVGDVRHRIDAAGVARAATRRRAPRIPAASYRDFGFACMVIKASSSLVKIS
jgi:hypothetical protein